MCSIRYAISSAKVSVVDNLSSKLHKILTFDNLCEVHINRC